MAGYSAQNWQYLTIMVAILFGYHGNGGSEWKSSRHYYSQWPTLFQWIDKFAKFIKYPIELPHLALKNNVLRNKVIW